MADRIVAWRQSIVLSSLLAAFLGLHSLLPLGTAIKIGADEDGELSKATLYTHGYKLYSEVWDDQPPLHTFIDANLLRHVSHSVLVPRLLTVAFAIALLIATFLLIQAVSGLLTASLATAMLMGSPGFLELSSSAMLEIPALAPIVAGLFFLWARSWTSRALTEIIAGALYGLALQMKLIGVVYLPIAGLMLWLRTRCPSVKHRSGPSPACTPWPVRIGTRDESARTDSGEDQFWKGSLVFVMSMIMTFVALNYLTGSPLLLQLQQSWASHFGATRSFEYGSPQDYPYDWTVLLKNWETTLPALLGMWVLFRKLRRTPEAALPLGWLAITLVAFGGHKPWWPYYYIHNALPLCWCAGVGISFLCDWVRVRWIRNSTETGRNRKFRRLASGQSMHAARFLPRGKLIWWQIAVFSILGVCGLGWMVARVYLEEQAIRQSPKLYTCLVLKKIERFKPFTTFMFTDHPIFSFHADLPMPPHLSVMPLKQLWTGDLTSAGLVTELESLKPGVILLGNDSKEVPYEELLTREYRLVYQDRDNRLYAHQSISKKPPLGDMFESLSSH